MITITIIFYTNGKLYSAPLYPRTPRRHRNRFYYYYYYYSWIFNFRTL